MAANTGKGPNIGDGSGNGIAEFETGYVSSMGQRTPASGGDASLYFGMPEYAMYVNDSWNVSSKLTVSFGARYDLPDPCIRREQLLGCTGHQIPRMADGHARANPWTDAHPFAADKKDLAPRIGLALPARKQYRDPQRLRNVL